MGIHQQHRRGIRSHPPRLLRLWSAPEPDRRVLLTGAEANQSGG